MAHFMNVDRQHQSKDVNQPPKTVQYNPRDRNIDRNVLALVSPSRRNFALPKSKTAANFLYSRRRRPACQ